MLSKLLIRDTRVTGRGEKRIVWRSGLSVAFAVGDRKQHSN